MLQAIRGMTARDWGFLAAVVAVFGLLIAIALCLLVLSDTFLSGALAAALNVEVYWLLTRPLCRWYDPR